MLSCEALMVCYTHENGYANSNLDEVRKVIDELPLPAGSMARIVLRELAYDFEVLLKVVDGKDSIFRHADGSETRRIKLY